ncbi:hypothetical protein ACWGB8_24715 [Kitasatospora sp. NPDC054939]
MPRNPRKSAVLLPLFLAPMAAWAAWLGWDQHHDVHPDGSVSGPYEAWQVAGLLVTLLVPLSWAASRGRTRDAVLGTTAGLTVAAWYDWSDDSSGLYVIGVGTVAVASLAVTSVLSALIARVTVQRRRRGPAGA